MKLASTMTARCALVLLAFAYFTADLRAQERPFDTNICALLQHPEKYNEGLVSVDGWVIVGPQEFSFHNATCGDADGQIWLQFGGDVPSPGSGDGGHGSAGRTRNVEGLELPLTKDRSFDAMQKLLDEAQKSRKTKMLRATLVGKYFAGKPTETASGETMHSGYGRMGCCSMFVIQEVMNVGDELEEPVDFSPVSKVRPRNMIKGCTVSDLTVPPQEDEDQLERKSLEEEYKYLHDPKQVAARAIAVNAQLGDEEVAKHLQTEMATETLATYTWSSTDGVSSYRMVVNRPYWLLTTAVSGDAVIWVPKQMVKTDCPKPERPPNIPITH